MAATIGEKQTISTLVSYQDPRRLHLELTTSPTGQLPTICITENDGLFLANESPMSSPVHGFRPPRLSIETNVNEDIRRKKRAIHPLEFPSTPYVRSHQQIWPHTSFVSGAVHIQEYDLRVHKDRPSRLAKGHDTIATEQEFHKVMQYTYPPPLHGPYETVRTLHRLNEILAEERSLNSFDRYEYKKQKLEYKLANSNGRLALW